MKRPFPEINRTRCLRKRLSLPQAILALCIIVGILSLMYYYALCNWFRVDEAGEALASLLGEIATDLQDHGRSDLSEVRRRWRRTVPPPLIWTKVQVISNDAEYEGRVVCYCPRNYFGKLARSAVGIVLFREAEGGGYGGIVTPIKGRPDLLREKGTTGNK